MTKLSEHTVDINSGAIDGVVIGGATPAAATVTTLTATGTITAGANIVSDTDSTDDLGTTSVRWRFIYVDDVVVTTSITAGGAITLNNNQVYKGKDTGGTAADLIQANSSDQVQVGDSSYVTLFAGSSHIFNTAVAFTADSTLNNNIVIQGKEMGGTARELLQMNASDVVQLGDANNATLIKGTAVTVENGLTVTGALSKGSGSFRIDHPLKPETHQLVHSFIEGPKADLIYRGSATLSAGYAVIDIDESAGMTSGTFQALCSDVQCFVSNNSSFVAVKGSVSGKFLTISAETSCNDVVDWMVIGERCDQHMKDTDWTDENGHVIVEPLK